MIKLPYPPTVNTYYSVVNGRKILSKKGRVYKAEAALSASLQAKPMDGPYSVYIAARPPDKRKRDLDNLLKPLLDTLTEAGIITDDSAIDDIRIVRMNPVKGGYVEVLVSGRTE